MRCTWLLFDLDGRQWSRDFLSSEEIGQSGDD